MTRKLLTCAALFLALTLALTGLAAMESPPAAAVTVSLTQTRW